MVCDLGCECRPLPACRAPSVDRGGNKVFLGERDAHQVILLTLRALGGSLRFAREIRRHNGHFALKVGGGSAGAGFNTHAHRRADRDLIDVLRRALRLDDQGIGARGNLHHHIAFADHATDRMNLKLIHNTGLRRADIGAFELISGRICALLKFGDLGLGFAQILQ